VFGLIADRDAVGPAELYEVFNMGVGFCCVVPADAAAEAEELLGRRHPGAGVIGHVTADAGVVELPAQGLAGRRGTGFAAAWRRP
jgi:phosphoribosylformylglycinamidine cyclo-ligase